MTRRDWMEYLATGITFALLVGVAAWFVSAWLGVSGDGRLVIAFQAPVVALLALWFVAVLFGRKR